MIVDVTLIDEDRGNLATIELEAALVPATGMLIADGKTYQVFDRVLVAPDKVFLCVASRSKRERPLWLRWARL
jgi:hypothetical protein